VKTLLLMRHAKSDWNAEYGRDHERPLNDRGVVSAKRMGKVLTSKQFEPDLVISSTATRARTTAELAKAAGGWRAPIALEPALYGASSREVIQVASAAPDVDTLMLVGHQPTWSMTAAALTGSYVEVKTATVVVIEVDIESWAELDMGRLVEVLHPRDFTDG